MSSDTIDQISQVGAGCWQNDRTEKIDKDHKSHTETAESTEIFQKDQFGQIVDGGVNPATSLGDQNPPGLGSSSGCIGVGDEFVGHGREMLGHQCREISILTQGKKILLVQCVDIAIAVFADDFLGDDERPTLVCRPQSVHAEARARQYTFSQGEQKLLLPSR